MDPPHKKKCKTSSIEDIIPLEKVLYNHVKIGNLNAVVKLLTKYKDIDVNAFHADEHKHSTWLGPLYSTPLIRSIRDNNVDIFKALENYKSTDVNVQHQNDGTALTFAVLNGNMVIVRLLLNSKKKINVNIQSGCKMDINFQSGREQFTPLMFAIDFYNSDMVRLLLTSKEININIPCIWEDTAYIQFENAIQLAYHNVDIEIVKMLIKKGASVKGWKDWSLSGSVSYRTLKFCNDDYIELQLLGSVMKNWILYLSDWTIHTYSLYPAKINNALVYKLMLFNRLESVEKKIPKDVKMLLLTYVARNLTREYNIYTQIFK